MFYVFIIPSYLCRYLTHLPTPSHHPPPSSPSPLSTVLPPVRYSAWTTSILLGHPLLKEHKKKKRWRKSKSLQRNKRTGEGLIYCTEFYCIVLFYSVLYCIVLYSTVLYCTVLYCTVLYCTVLYCTVLYVHIDGVMH